jgi:hypothetical protein
MPCDLLLHLIFLCNNPSPCFPFPACPRFYSFLYILYIEAAFSPLSNLLPPSYPHLLEWVGELHLQGTLSDFTPEEIYTFTLL